MQRRSTFFSLVAATSFALAALSCPLTARADDAAMNGIGGSLRVQHANGQVQMVSETVVIDKLPGGHVVATFWLKNTGKPIDVTIGFPGCGGGDSGSPELSGFKSWVDGKRVAVKLIKPKPQNNDLDDETIEWFVKRVHFDANQTHVVRDEYTGGGGLDSMESRWFSYYLHTGASWRGVIRHATITADISGLKPFQITDIKPLGYKRSGSTITWSFTNLKPTIFDDIDITYYPAFLKVVVNGTPMWDTTMASQDWRSKVDSWGSAVSLRRGDDVYLSARTAAAWLGAKLTVVQPNKVVRIARGDRWVDVTLGSKVLTASSGAKIALPAPSDLGHGSELFGATTDRYVMAYLKPIVTGLGGKAAMETASDKMYVTLPPVGK